MRLDQDTYDRIMSYLNGEMTTTEKNDFLRSLENDMELSETVTILNTMYSTYGNQDWPTLEIASKKLKETRLLFNNDDVTDFSNNVKGSFERYQNKTKTKKILTYISSIAAIVLIAFFLNYYSGLNNSSEHLFNAYYDSEDLPSFIIQNNDVTTNVKAEILFKEGQFTEALELFNSINEELNTLNPNITLYLAMCNLELENYGIALKYLEELENSNTIDFHKTYWFKSLVYLKQDQKDNAIQSLKILSKNSQYFNHDKAIDLLKKLE